MISPSVDVVFMHHIHIFCLYPLLSKVWCRIEFVDDRVVDHVRQDDLRDPFDVAKALESPSVGDDALAPWPTQDGG